MRVAMVHHEGRLRIARLDEMPDDEKEAILAQATIVHDLSGPEPVSEVDGQVHRRGRPDPDHPGLKATFREEIAERRRQRDKPPKKGGKQK